MYNWPHGDDCTIAKLKNISAILAILDLRPSTLKYVVPLVEDPSILKAINNPTMFDSAYIIDLVNSFFDVYI